MASKHVGVLGKYEDLKGKRVLVTGGSQGIGKAIAVAFASNGAVVTISGRTKSKLDDALQQLGHGGGAHAVVTDLMDVEDSKRGVQEAVRNMGGLDVLVLSGGAFNEVMFTQPTSAEAFQSALQLHLFSAVATIEAALPQLTASGGSVIILSSIMSVIPSVDFPSYSVAKASLDALVRVYALRYAKDGVRFNTLKSGAVATDAVTALAQRRGTSLEELTEGVLGPGHALGRIGLADEQAAAALFLGSAASSFITGDAIATGGGAELGFWFNESYQQKPVAAAVTA